jgi:DNA polymerase-3 subunit gamma/tau
VNYQHTLEHLNILDADYYFRLIDCMLQQDLAGAMLLFDDIIRKGFEEELVLNGFSEFIRNLLICKDERIAGLLEVVESFREKYIATAKKTDAGYLVSALNILNEAEINYKSAKNKRLHVELALIRLTYLLQAIEMTASPEGVVKKKRVDEAKPVAFKNIPGFKAAGNVSAKKEPVAKVEEPKLVIEERRAPEPVIPAAKEPEKNVSVKSAQLDKIRRQIAERANASENKQAVPLEQERLQQAWNAYSATLRENKNPAVQSFDLAKLNIISESSFEVITNNNLEQKFIEQEKRVLSEYLQNIFGNRSLHFAVKITDSPVEHVPVEKTLSKKDQYLLITEQYPIIKELKERLKLDLDY